MSYEVHGNALTDPGYPPVLGRLDGPPGAWVARIYLSIPGRWVRLGPSAPSWLAFTGDWDPVDPDGVDTIIERIAQRTRPSTTRYWLTSDDVTVPGAIVSEGDDGPMATWSIPARTWQPADDPLRRPDRSAWLEMTQQESAAVVRSVR